MLCLSPDYVASTVGLPPREVGKWGEKDLNLHLYVPLVQLEAEFGPFWVNPQAEA